MVDNELTVVKYKAKTLQQTFTEIAGLLVLIRVATVILGQFHEYRYNRKIKRETQEEFREVFTYENFKRQIVINEQQNEEIARINNKVTELQEMMQEMIETSG